MQQKSLKQTFCQVSARKIRSMTSDEHYLQLIINSASKTLRSLRSIHCTVTQPQHIYLPLNRMEETIEHEDL